MWLTIVGIYVVLGLMWTFYDHAVAKEVDEKSFATVATHTLAWPIYMVNHIFKKLKK